MTHREFELWCDYRSKYGSLNPVRRYDQGHALVACMVNNAFGGKAKPLDFMPYGKEKPKEQIVDGDAFVNLLESSKGVKHGKRR